LDAPAAGDARIAAVLLSRGTLLPIAYSIVGVLPLFLVSAQAANLQHELGFGASSLGLAVSVSFAVPALTAVPLGHLLQRAGPSIGFTLAAATSFAALLWLAVVASRWWHVALALAVGGLAAALSQVSSNLAVAANVPHERQGLVFASKQAAMPAAALCAGLSVPLIGLVAGWRIAFFGAAALVLTGLVRRPRLVHHRAPPRATRDRRPSRPLLLLAACALLAGAVSTSLSAFTVASAAARGFSPAAAGSILALGSVASIGGRLAVGWLADHRRSSGLTELVALTGGGALGFALLSASDGSDALFLLGVAAAFATGWGWPAIIYFATVRAHPTTPGASTGFVLSGVYAGSIAGPTCIGLIAEHDSYGHAWALCAALLSLATLAALGARRLVRGRVSGPGRA
jgi:MFS family permease